MQKQRRSSFFTQAADLGDLKLAEAAGGDHIPLRDGGVALERFAVVELHAARGNELLRLAAAHRKAARRHGVEPQCRDRVANLLDLERGGAQV